MKLLITILVLAISAEVEAKTTLVRIAVPEWANYKTTDESGTVYLWSHKPKLIRTDFNQRVWWSTNGTWATINGGAPNARWKSSLRRVR